jgi:acetyl-CoA carboxylase carboxyltransferase component
MYPDVGDIAAAGVVAGIGLVHGRACMIVANDATVKAGAFFPQTCKKMLRAQRIAFECNIPLIYLVDSSGAYLPMQDEIFPDEDDFGRIFRNNSVISAAGIPQYSAIMGSCIAGGAYLPVLSDKILMTEGSGLYLAGPALVKAAIGQDYDPEELGGAKMHAEISGTVDFREKDDSDCLLRLRKLVDMLPEDKWGWPHADSFKKEPQRDPNDVYDIVDVQPGKEFDTHDLIDCIVDKDSCEEYRAEYGKTIITAFAKIGGVIYADSADKAARFIMNCNQDGLPIIFLQDVVGFMVGKAAEETGIIRSGAKLVNALSNAIVPKITVIFGGSFGAGNYAMCGKAYDPRFIFAWPNAQYAVMGAAQSSAVIFQIKKRAMEIEAKKHGVELDHEELERLRKQVYDDYAERTDIRYGAARGWVDAIIPPHTTREVLITTLGLVTRPAAVSHYKTGVIQT